MRQTFQKLIVVLLLGVFMAPVVYAKKPKKNRDRLRFKYNEVEEIWEDGVLKELNCTEAGNLRCKYEPIAASNEFDGFSSNDFENLSNLSEDLVDDLELQYPSGVPTTTVTGFKTRSITIVLPDQTTVNRLYRIDYVFNTDGSLEETYDYTDTVI